MVELRGEKLVQARRARLTTRSGLWILNSIRIQVRKVRQLRFDDTRHQLVSFGGTLQQQKPIEERADVEANPRMIHQRSRPIPTQAFSSSH